MSASSTGAIAPEREVLRATAELVGRLLLRELGPRELDALRDPRLAAPLAELGLELPSEDEQEAWLEERAADYHERFLRPASGPLVQSLWTQGRYEGDATVRVRALARAAGVEFQPGAARGAAPDHLGSLLLLWAATDARAPSIAGELAASHLAWSQAALERVARDGGFYGAVASLASALVTALTEAAVAGSGSSTHS